MATTKTTQNATSPKTSPLTREEIVSRMQAAKNRSSKRGDSTTSHLPPGLKSQPTGPEPRLVKSRELVYLPLNVVNIEHGIHTPYSDDATLFTVVDANGELYKFWAGSGIGRQIASGNPDRITDEELYSATIMVIPAKAHNRVTGLDVDTFYLDWFNPEARKTQEAAEVEEDSEEDSEEEYSEEDSEEEYSEDEEETDEQIIARIRGNKKTSVKPAPKAPVKPAPKAPVKPAPKAPKAPLTVIDVGEGEYGRRRPPTLVSETLAKGVQVYFSKRTGNYTTKVDGKNIVLVKRTEK